MKKKILIIIAIIVVVIGAAAAIIIPKLLLENEYKEKILRANNLIFDKLDFFEENKDYKDSAIYLEESKIIMTVMEKLDAITNREKSDEVSVANGYEYEEFNKIIDELDSLEANELSGVKYLSQAKATMLERIHNAKVDESRGYYHNMCVSMNIAMQMMMNINYYLTIAYNESVYYPYLKPSIGELRGFTGLTLNNTYCKNIKKKQKNSFNCVITDRKNDFGFISNVITNVPIAQSNAKVFGVSDEFSGRVNDMIKLLSAQNKFAKTYYKDINGAIYRSYMVINIYQNSSLSVSTDPSNQEVTDAFDKYLNGCEVF